MPGVLLPPAPFIDSRSAEAAGSPRYFSVILTVTFRDHRKVWWTRQAPPVFFISRGESRNRVLGGQKSRCHRHRTRPLELDCCGRGLVTSPPRPKLAALPPQSLPQLMVVASR